MPEHMPAPTFSRAVYGFVLYLTLKTMFVLYLIWTFVPDWAFTYFNISYIPQKYWTLVVPILCLNLIAIFGFLIYPGFNFCMTPDMRDLRTFTDSYAGNSRQRTKSSAALVERLQTNGTVQNNGWTISLAATKWDSIDDKVCSCKYIQRCSKFNNSAASTSQSTKQKQLPPHLNYSVPPVADISISDVCKNLYL